MAHRGRLLEGDADAAARRGVSEGLFGAVAEAVVLQAVTVRVAGGSDGRRSTRDPPVRQEDVAAVHAAHDAGRRRVDGEIGKGVCVCVCERVWEGSVGQANVFGNGKRVRFLTQVGACKGTGREGEKCSRVCVSGR